MPKHTHLVVGAGKMGGALIKGWLNLGIVKADELIILDPTPGEEARIAITAGALHLKKPSKKLKSVKYLLLGIKPQMYAKLAPDIAEHISSDALVISILAGTSMASLQSVFQEQRIIRAMPNTPAAIGKGITAYTKGPDISDTQIAMAEQLLAAGGLVRHVANEHLIDVVTAVSGSGPAYIFHMVEALEAAAIHIGMSPVIAPEFARQTVIGAAALLEASTESATELRQNVTSPNGTTQAALDVLMDVNGLPPLMRDTLHAALTRAKELADS